MLLDDITREAATKAVALALAEDLSECGDITSAALVEPCITASARFIFKEPAVLAGVPVVMEVCRQVSPDLALHALADDGARVERGAGPLEIRGDARAILAAERTAINFLSHLSGVATLTRAFVEAVAGTSAEILDTRKTLPGLRALQKYAVRCGGGVNHRFGLYDQVLAKDNHLALLRRAGGQTRLDEALKKIRDRVAPGIVIEIEAKTTDEVEAALAAGADIIMLDNMTLSEMAVAVMTVRRSQRARVLVEASGGVTLETVRAVAETGVDRISVGALTHSPRSIDISLEIT